MKNALFTFTMMLAALGAGFAQTKSATPAPKAAAKAGATKAAGPNLMNPATLVIRVNKAWAPIGADRFYNLVRAGYYNNQYIFRSTSQFAQFGIPSKPELSRVWMEKTMFDDRAVQSNKRGFVSFAATDAKNSRSVQVFISKVDNAYLDSYGFAPFGEVIEGLENLDMLYTGYGETITQLQGEIMNQGNVFLDKNYPRLDKITTAVIEPLPDDTKAKQP
jgi:cyclophilin family peptidyl-prolyl cis-trans isomerase